MKDVNKYENQHPENKKQNTSNNNNKRKPTKHSLLADSLTKLCKWKKTYLKGASQ
jgi:hypothetical protein